MSATQAAVVWPCGARGSGIRLVPSTGAINQHKRHKKNRGRPPLRWIDTIRHDLKAADLSVESALQAAGDRLTWLDTVDRCVDSAPV